MDASWARGAGGGAQSTSGQWRERRGSFRRSGGNPPHRVADVVGDQKRARFVDCDTDRPAERLSIVVYEAGENIDRLSRRAAVLEGHEDDFVAAERLAIPRSVLSDEGATAVWRGQ